ncbi:MAG: GNAT family N-acetyltransferase [Ginsengibacter sp.]
MIQINEITIRNNLNPGDIGYIIYLHGNSYKEEYNYGTEFEIYVASGLLEFYQQYDPRKDRIWICEHQHRIIGSLVLVHRKNNSAQLRFFLIEPAYRGLGLGKKLMELSMEFFYQSHYQSCYLWTNDELGAAASLYKRHRFKLAAEKSSNAFGKKITEQRYDLLSAKNIRQ